MNPHHAVSLGKMGDVFSTQVPGVDHGAATRNLLLLPSWPAWQIFNKFLVVSAGRECVWGGGGVRLGFIALSRRLQSTRKQHQRSDSAEMLPSV